MLNPEPPSELVLKAVADYLTARSRASQSKFFSGVKASEMFGNIKRIAGFTMRDRAD